MSDNVGLVKVNLHVLAEMLRMPAGSEITHVIVDPLRADVVMLRVRHPDMPLMRDAQWLGEFELVLSSDPAVPGYFAAVGGRI